MPHARDHCGAPSAGFTLIEMLVAIALVGLLTVGLFAALRFGMRATAGTDRALDHSAQLALVYTFLQARLDNAQPFPASEVRGQPAILFNGTADAIEFVTTSPTQLVSGGFALLRIMPAHEAAQTNLIALLRGIDRRSVGSSDADLPPSTLIDHIARARFAYFGELASEDSNEWHDQWNATDHLPLMVRMRVDFADGWHSPDLIFAPHLAVVPEEGG